MLQLSYDEIIRRIKFEKDLPIEELESRVKKKMDQLSGLISKEGAAYIVANELGVRLIKTDGLLKIKDILTGMRSVETAGRVVRKFDITDFEKDGRKGRVGSFIVADDTGQVRVTCWHEMCELLGKFNEGDLIKIVGGYVRDNRGQKEIHLNEKSKIILNPEDISLPPLRTNAVRKKISELVSTDQNVEIFGTIVQVFDPRFYEVCPECGKKPIARDDGFMCEEHGAVKPTYSYVVNAIIDDGSDNIRVVFFRNQALRLFQKDDEQMQSLRLGSFDAIKTELLGEQIKVVGRVTNNSVINRLELIATQVHRDIDPAEEIKRLEA
ncbi:MAG: OB-fold nucleic acid binding domain-containing protein [Candidatus Woesearchaeota archaeon]